MVNYQSTVASRLFRSCLHAGICALSVGTSVIRWLRHSPRMALNSIDLLRPKEGWATSEDWFAAAGHPAGKPRRLGFDSYSYVLEAAAGTLVAVGDGFVESDRGLYAVLTGKGRRKPLARRCLACFELD